MQYIIGSYGNVLHTRATVKIKVLFNLRLLFALSWLVYRKFDAAIAVAHYFAHQSRIVSADVLIIKADKLRKAHYVFIEIDPWVHFVPAYVAHHVVNVL